MQKGFNLQRKLSCKCVHSLPNAGSQSAGHEGVCAGDTSGGAGWATGPRKEPWVALRAAWAGVREDAEGREDGDGQLWGGHWDLRMG